MRKWIVWTAAAVGLAGALAGLSAPDAQAGKPGGGGGGGGGTFTPAIACARAGKSGKSELVVMAADGSGTTVVVSGLGIAATVHAAWSPDGSHLAFNGRPGDPGVWTAGADGSGAARIVSMSAGAGSLEWSPAAAPDGAAKIAFAGGDEDVYLVNPDGSGLLNLTNTAASYRREDSPTWSPDATQIAVVREGGNGGAGADIVVFDLGVDSGGALTITGETSLVVGVTGSPLAGAYIGSLEWSRDGTRLAIAARPSGSESRIYVLELDTPGDASTVAATSGTDDLNPTWTPDDGALVFRRRFLGNGGSKNDGLYTVGSGGAGFSVLVKGDYWNPVRRR